MFVYWNQVWIILFFTILTFGMINTKTADWLANLIRYTKNDFRAYQLVMLFDQNEKNITPNQESIHQIISRKLPTWKISFQEATIKRAEDLSLHRSFLSLQTTLLFLIIGTSENFSRLYSSFEFISEISFIKSRPKCLIIVPEELNNSYDRFLRFLWKKQFIDVSILGYKNVEGKIEDSAILVYFNPFTNSTTRTLFHKSFQNFEWFPLKTADLRGLEMKVGAFHQPPSSYLTFDKKGEILKARGQDITMMRTIAEAMNFRIKWTSSNETSWGNISCERNLLTGLIRMVAFNEISMIAIQGGRLASCDEVFYEWSTNTDPYILALVVPIIQEEGLDLSFEWKLSTLGYLSTIFLVTWFVGLLLKFDRKSWGILNIMLIVFGFGTPQSPRKLAERIVFGALLLSCLFHSSYIYTAVTDVGLQKKSEMELKTIKDVLMSPLQPLTDQGTFLGTFSFTEGSSRLLLSKSTIKDLSYNDCLDLLIKNGSIVCLVTEEVAQMRVHQEKDENDHPVMKIVDERFQSGTMGILLESRSPFVTRINEIIRRLTQAGIFEKWRENSIKGPKIGPKRYHEMWSLDELKTNQILKQMTLLLFYAQSISCLVFICELLVSYVRKRL